MDAAQEISRLIGPLRRTVLRRTRHAAGLPDLPDAQIELLRVLESHPGLGVRQVAEHLRVAPSTVSNLVRDATVAGLLERRPSATDRRAVELYPSRPALGLLGTYDRFSRELLSDALARLTAADRRAIERATPALTRLLAALDEGAGER